MIEFSLRYASGDNIPAGSARPLRLSSGSAGADDVACSRGETRLVVAASAGAGAAVPSLLFFFFLAGASPASSALRFSFFAAFFAAFSSSDPSLSFFFFFAFFSSRIGSAAARQPWVQPPAGAVATRAWRWWLRPPRAHAFGGLGGLLVGFWV